MIVKFISDEEATDNFLRVLDDEFASMSDEDVHAEARVIFGEEDVIAAKLDRIAANARARAPHPVETATSKQRVPVSGDKPRLSFMPRIFSRKPLVRDHAPARRRSQSARAAGLGKRLFYVSLEAAKVSAVSAGALGAVFIACISAAHYFSDDSKQLAINILGEGASITFNAREPVVESIVQGSAAYVRALAGIQQDVEKRLNTYTSFANYGERLPKSVANRWLIGEDAPVASAFLRDAKAPIATKPPKSNLPEPATEITFEGRLDAQYKMPTVISTATMTKALGGDAEAQTRLGIAYEKGLAGFDKDPLKAAALYWQASDQGASYARLRLAHLYDVGEGNFPKDRSVAIKLYGSLKTMALANERLEKLNPSRSASGSSSLR